MIESADSDITKVVIGDAETSGVAGWVRTDGDSTSHCRRRMERHDRRAKSLCIKLNRLR